MKTKKFQQSDEGLMRRVQKGDIGAFGELYNRYNERLFHFIFRFMGEKILAEDILQETFLRIFKDRGHYRKIAPFSAYLFTIGRNLCLDALKKSKRRHELPSQEAYVEKAVDPSKWPSETLEESEISEIVRREVDALPGDQRQVILLNKYSGLSYAEIALILERTPGAVKQIAYRAMLSLKQKLGKLDV